MEKKSKSAMAAGILAVMWMASLIIAMGYGGRVVLDGVDGYIEENRPRITVRDTITDTIPFYVAVPKDSVVLRYKTVRLPVADTVYISRQDGVAADSVEVTVPIEQKEYADSAYQAWVSGFQPRLDSIKIFQRTVVQREVVRKCDRWGLGVQLGAGYNGNKAGPYIGIGISYNILNW